MPGGELPAGLLGDIKAILDVTWHDPATDAKYTALIQSGMAYLDDKCGGAADYAVPGEPRTLLTEYVRYARDSALDVFETNYLNRLLAMQNKRRLSAYVAATVPPQGEQHLP